MQLRLIVLLAGPIGEKKCLYQRGEPLLVPPRAAQGRRDKCKTAIGYVFRAAGLQLRHVSSHPCNAPLELAIQRIGPSKIDFAEGPAAEETRLDSDCKSGPGSGAHLRGVAPKLANVRGESV